MNSIRTLRLLSLLGFLFLFAPFYRQCAQAEAPAAEAPVTEELGQENLDPIALTRKNDSIDKVLHLQFIKDSIAAIKTRDSLDEVTPTYWKLYQTIDDEISDNAFEMAYVSVLYFEIIYSKPREFCEEFAESKKTTKATYIARPIRLTAFFFICIFTFFSLVASFIKKYKLVYVMSRCTVVLLFLSFGCIFLDTQFETLDQIKWGYYAFTTTQILILIVSHKISKQSLSD